MSDTVKIIVSQLAWTDVTAGAENGLITNNSGHSIRYREALTQPSITDTFGHILHPQSQSYFDLVGGQKVWALGFAYDATVALTVGLGLTKDLGLTRDFFFQVSAGKVPGYLAISKFGHNPSVGALTTEDVWAAGGALIHLQAADTMTVVSSDAGDNQAGLGARSIFIQGCDLDFNDISETLNLHPTDGTIAVTTVNSYTRIWRANIIDVGVYGGSNLGNITIADTGAVGTQSFIEIGEGQTDGTHYTVPAGKTAYMLRPGIVTDTSKSVNVHMITRQGADIVVSPFKSTRHRQHWIGLDAPFSELYRIFKTFPEKTDIWFECVNAGGAASAVSVDYDIMVVDN